MANILVVDDDAFFRDALAKKFAREGHQLVTASTLTDALEITSSQETDVIFLDVHLPDGSGLTALPRFGSQPGRPTVVIITGLGDPDGAELAIKSGAWDYITKPVRNRELSLVLSRVLQYRSHRRSAASGSGLNREGIIGRSAVIQARLELLGQAAASEASVLITGPTGSGKELFARAVHDNSPRAKGPFVVVDCAALPGSLVESVLFGHVKGAFTGADQPSQGLIKHAHQGTLFLDEVGELPLSMQKAFLRVLVERLYRPVGGQDQVASDFRLVAATNQDLPAMVAQGRFREDLLFRLRSFVIDVPPLQERIGDIKELVDFRLEWIRAAKGLGPKDVSADFLETLEKYSWPGNVRELFAALERAVAVARDEPTLYPHHLPGHIRIDLARTAAAGRVPQPPPDGNGPSVQAGLPTLKQYRETMERHYLIDLMTAARGNVKEGCRISGLSPSSLYALLKKYDITRPGWGGRTPNGEDA
jgi:DNA-binding NtrC family response regulator